MTKSTSRATATTRKQFLNWLSVWDDSHSGFLACPIQLHDMTADEAALLTARLSRRAHMEAARCIAGAAALTLKGPRMNVYHPAQLMACEALRLWLDMRPQEFMTWLGHQKQLVFVIFGGHRVPTCRHLRDFSEAITPAQWREFTCHLRSFSPILADFYTALTT